MSLDTQKENEESICGNIKCIGLAQDHLLFVVAINELNIGKELNRITNGCVKKAWIKDHRLNLHKGQSFKVFSGLTKTCMIQDTYRPTIKIYTHQMNFEELKNKMY
jgi:hypothetical protein